MRRTIVVFLTLLCMCLPLSKARAAGDSIQVSLLTCSPGTEVYALYGHTGLRMNNYTKHFDWVFNYGVFDFNQPNFAWKFVLGHCDYEVAPIPFDAFVDFYAERGSSVMEQVLNLTTEEKNHLWALLLLNCRPENRVYRYDFLRNNCTTKVRDQIDRAVDGHVVYREAEKRTTYRQLLHDYTADYPWEETGCDMLLGADCDTVLSDRAAQFLPEQLMQYYADAQIYDDANNRRPLVASTQELVPARRTSAGSDTDVPLTPLYVGLILLSSLLLVMWLEHRYHRMWWLLDVFLMLLQGLVGVLICFMFFFSEHPTMNSNWHILLLNPLPLFFIPQVVRSALQHKVCFYHYMSLLWFLLFVVFMAWIPQDFPLVTVFLALSLLTRPLSYCLNGSDNGHENVNGKTK